MQLIPAKNGAHWIEASDVLRSVVDRLNSLEAPLWTMEQVAPDELKNTYDDHSLFWLVNGGERIGLVFLMDSDTNFWPELDRDNTSIFFHKLAINPDFRSRGYGAEALEAIVAYARNKGYLWVRFDCDDREPLHEFYQSAGFQFVDKKKVDGFNVVRYQLQI